MRHISIAGIVFLFSVVITFAQDNCPAIVTDTILELQTVCSATGRNQLCYVNNQVLVETRADDVVFTAPGDLIDIAIVDSIQTLVVPEDEIYGVALMQLQANLPDTLPGQNVTVLLYGDTTLENADSEPESENESFAPMQAMYFSTGIGQSECNDLPSNGILIQTPEYNEPIELFINGTEILLGSTAFITAQPESTMVIYIIEGEGIITAENRTVIVPEGAFTTVELDDTLNAISAPSQPAPYTQEAVAQVAVEAELVADPAGEESIDEANTYAGIVAGCWTSIDMDTSSQTFCIQAIARNQFRIHLRDEGGSVCSDTRTLTDVVVVANGTGSVNGNNVLDTQIHYQCLGGNNANGDVPIAYTFNSDGTITDNFGVIWTR